MEGCTFALVLLSVGLISVSYIFLNNLLKNTNNFWHVTCLEKFLDRNNSTVDEIDQIVRLDYMFKILWIVIHK